MLRCIPRTLGPVTITLLFAAATPVHAQAPFVMGGVTAAPGTLASGDLRVPAGASDDGTVIPFTVIHGSRPGPVLALIAGTHGVEYPPVLALQRLRTAIDPRPLTGTVVLVHVANMPSFLARTIYYGPKDGQNLNRVFPGKRDGTLSERIAYVITTEVIDRATHVIDIHCGDGNEWLRPYSYWVVTSAPAVVAASKNLALAFGLDHIVIDTERPSDPAASVYLANTAMTRGKPALSVTLTELQVGERAVPIQTRPISVEGKALQGGKKVKQAASLGSKIGEAADPWDGASSGAKAGAAVGLAAVAKSSPDALAKKKGFKDMVLTGFSSKPSPAPPAGVPGKSGE